MWERWYSKFMQGTWRRHTYCMLCISRWNSVCLSHISSQKQNIVSPHHFSSINSFACKSEGIVWQVPLLEQKVVNTLFDFLWGLNVQTIPQLSNTYTALRLAGKAYLLILGEDSKIKWTPFISLGPAKTSLSSGWEWETAVVTVTARSRHLAEI